MRVENTFLVRGEENCFYVLEGELLLVASTDLSAGLRIM
jgi:hypothetical protein